MRVAIHDWGGDGPPTLLAHATGFHGMVWAPVAEQLVAAGRRVWSFDFRGHGDSDRDAGGGYDWTGFAEDVHVVVGRLGLAGDPRLVTVGHSKGAAALLLAEATAPGTFARIWGYEPIVFPSDDPVALAPDNPMSRRARRRRAVWSSPDEAYRSFSVRPPLEVLAPAALRAYVDHGLRRREDGAYELKCRPEDEAEVYAMGAANGVYPRLGEVHCPVRVVHGEHTDEIQKTFSTRLVERLPRGELEIARGLGHFGPLEDPAWAARSVLDFATTT